MREGSGSLLLSADSLILVLAVVLAGLGIAIGWRWWLKRRVTPAERERRRRCMLVVQGKMGDASLVDMRDGHLFYTYAVRGVEYTASQDVSALGEVMPPQPSLGAAHILVKFDPRNPANSIVIAEDWSGFRDRTN